MRPSRRYGMKNVYRAVVDTNLIVFGTVSANTPPYHLFEAWRKGYFILVTSPPILEEVRDVLFRPEIQKLFDLTGKDVEEVISTLVTRAFITSGELTVDVVKNDPDDNKFIACALEGTATHIVTGDRKHLLPLRKFQGIPVVTARIFLENFLKYPI